MEVSLLENPFRIPLLQSVPTSTSFASSVRILLLVSSKRQCLKVRWRQGLHCTSHSSLRRGGFQYPSKVDLQISKRKFLFSQVASRPVYNQAVNKTGGDGQEEVELAVFRFTLGIPGFDDGELPRLVGILFGGLLALNHVLAPQPVTDAQLRSELIGLVLAALATVLPTIGLRLQELRGGRKPRSSSGQVPQVFALAQNLNELQQQDLAWASYALLRNTNATSVLLYHRGRVICARGQWKASTLFPGEGQDTADRQNVLENLTVALEKVMQSSPSLRQVMSSQGDMLYLPSGLPGLGGLPLLLEDASSFVAQSFSSNAANVESDGFLIALSNKPRGFLSRDRVWVSAMASKLALSL